MRPETTSSASRFFRGAEFFFVWNFEAGANHGQAGWAILKKNSPELSKPTAPVRNTGLLTWTEMTMEGVNPETLSRGGFRNVSELNRPNDRSGKISCERRKPTLDGSTEYVVWYQKRGNPLLVTMLLIKRWHEYVEMFFENSRLVGVKGGQPRRLEDAESAFSVCRNIAENTTDGGFDTKRRKKKGEEEDVCYPYRSNKKDDMRLFWRKSEYQNHLYTFDKRWGFGWGK